HSPPRFCLGEDLAFLIEYPGNHPFVLRLSVSAANNIDVVFASSSCCQHRVAAPDRKGNDLRAIVGELSRDFREKSVIAHHQSHLTKARVENRELISWH